MNRLNCVRFRVGHIVAVRGRASRIEPDEFVLAVDAAHKYWSGYLDKHIL